MAQDLTGPHKRTSFIQRRVTFSKFQVLLLGPQTVCVYTAGWAVSPERFALRRRGASRVYLRGTLSVLFFPSCEFQVLLLGPQTVCNGNGVYSSGPSVKRDLHTYPCLLSSSSPLAPCSGKGTGNKPSVLIYSHIILPLVAVENHTLYTTVQKFGGTLKCPYFWRKSTVLFNEDNFKLVLTLKKYTLYIANVVNDYSSCKCLVFGAIST